MSTDDSAASTDDSDSASDGFADLRARLRSLPRRTAPSSFEADLERRLTSPPRVPAVRVLPMRPFLAVVTTIGGLLLFLSFLLSPGRIDPTPSPAAAPAARSSPNSAGVEIEAKSDTARPDSLAALPRSAGPSR